MNFHVGESELERVVSVLNHSHGIDFSGYSKASLTRRIQRIADKDGNGNFNALLQRVAHDPQYFSRFLKDVTVNVTEMFRDADFFAAVRTKVLPELQKRNQLNVWHAACSTGEEVYSMAILLHEAKLLKRSALLGTDLNPEVLQQATRGEYSMNGFSGYAESYRNSGGQASLSDYHTTISGKARFHDFIRESMHFSKHDLVKDSAIGQFDLIMCRNALIYFQKPLQSRVLRLFKESLSVGGFLCLGANETLLFAEDRAAFEVVDAKEKIYRKL